ncbi:MAG: hypothetical protein OJF62_003369 [Pseudolabrys sp.]|jgi:hypothetical protein|nr:hypothetical protein [Pseudolabrys sp.]
MRKLITLLAAAAFLAAPASQSLAARRLPPPSHSNHLTPWPTICGIASAASVMVGTEIKANDQDKTKRRQLTITEATWWASVCPVVLPLALLSTATCPDNKATYEVARLAYLYVKKHPGADQSAFTNAYAEACHTGKLSRATLRILTGLAH